MQKRWQLVLGAAISALFLIIALRGLDLGHVWLTVKKAQYAWLIPSVAVYFLAVWARVWRWHYLLQPIKKIPLRAMWPMTVVGYMGNNIYPFRAGEVMRAYLLRRRQGVSISSGLATILVERVFDGLVMLIFVFLVLPAVPDLPQWLQRTVILASIAFLGALTGFFVLAAMPIRSRDLYRRVIVALVPSRWRKKVLGLADRFMEGLRSLAHPRAVGMVFLSSIVIWLLETVKYWFVMHAFPFEVSFFTLMLMNGVVNLATTLPSAPGYIGTFDAPGIEVLRVFGVQHATAVGYTLVLHAALWFPITALGAYYMVRESLHWRDFERARETAAVEAKSP